MKKTVTALRGPFPLLLGAAILGCSSSSPAPGTPTDVTPTPTPVPAPTPTPPPAVGVCTLPALPDCGPAPGYCCRKGGDPLFDVEIAAAMEAVTKSSPGMFKKDGSLRVSDEEYTTAVAEKITEMFGLCARGGDRKNAGGGGHSISEDEVGVKRDNRVSQNVDIVIGTSRRPAIVERYTCRPASF